MFQVGRRLAACIVLVAAVWELDGMVSPPAVAGEPVIRLGRGINIVGYDPIWKSRSKGRFQAEHFTQIRGAGFDHVRVNLQPFRDAEANGSVPGSYWDTLDWVVEQALDNKLAVILDFHEFIEMATDPAAKKERFLTIWRQIAERYKNAPREVVFELLNEPNGQLTPKLWNGYLREALAVVREANPTRAVIVGPGHWNSIEYLDDLELPAGDRNLIVTIHYYNPFEFTHQGAPWTNQKDKSGVVWKGSDLDRQLVARDFDRAQAWAKSHQRPLYLGEFGAYDKADMPSRTRYLDYVARQAEKRGWSWAYWQFDSDFIAYDMAKRQWIAPILQALIPPAHGR
jgi:endoglucanase